MNSCKECPYSTLFTKGEGLCEYNDEEIWLDGEVMKTSIPKECPMNDRK